MAEIPTTPPQPRIRLRAAVGITLLLLVVIAALYLNSDSFRDSVRDRVVAELERVTGGRVDLHTFRWNLSKLEFEADDLTIHGLEPPDTVPYAHLDHLKVRLKLISLASRQFGLRYLYADRPVLHIMVNKDGSTNQPTPKIKMQSNRDPVDELFDLAIEDLVVSNGVLIWNDRKTPLDFSAQNVAMKMTYAMLQRRYDGTISVGSSNLVYKEYKPLPGNAELQFSMTPEGVEIRSLKWASLNSRFEASGRIVNIHSIRVELTYNASVDLAELGAMAKLPELRKGRADVTGTGNIALGGAFASSGRVVVHGLEYRTPATQVSNVEGSSQFSIDQNKLDLKSIFLRLFGGTVRGEGSIANYANLNQRDPRQQQHGILHLELSGVEVRNLATALSSRAMPLEQLKAEGAANGTVAVAWSGSPNNAEAQLALRVAPPVHPSAGALPMAAEVHGTYHLSTGALQLSQMDMTTPGGHITANGGLGTANSQMQLSLETNNLAEFKPLLAAAGNPNLPMDLQGKAAFHGVVSGTVKSPIVRGHIDITNFDSLLPALAFPAPATTASTKPAALKQIQRIHWDSLSTDVQYSPSAASARNGVLKRGTAQLTFAGDTALNNGKFTDASLFHLRFNVANAALQDVQSIAGIAYPVTGTLSATATVSGTMNDLRGDGNVQLVSGTAYGEPFKFFRSNVRFAGQEAQFTDVAFSQNGAQVTGAGAYNFTARSFRFDLRGNNIELAHLQRLQSAKMTLAGLGTFHATGSGTVDQPIINADFQVQDLTMNGEKMGDLAADAVTRGDDLQLKVRSKIVGADLSADGHVRLAGTFPGDITVQMQHLDFDPLLHLFLPSAQISGHSAMNGSFHVSGPFRQWRSLNASGRIDQFSAEVQKVALQSDGPVIFNVESQTLHLDRFHIKGDGTDMTASGTAQITGDRKLNLRADGRANLKVLQSLDPSVLSYGFTTVALSVGGTVSKPALAGTVKIENAGVSLVDLPNGFADINGTLVFNEDRLTVQTLTAKSGGGGLEFGGYIAYQNGPYFDLTARGRQIRLRYPPGISALANADLRLSGNVKRSLLTGDVVVTRFGVNPRFDFALYLARSKQPPTTPQANSMLNNLHMDVHVITTPELTVETSLAKISGDADLRIRGTGTRPAVLGRVNVSEGDIFFNGTKYRLERGDVTFTNPVRIEPVLNMEASARVREYDITIGFHGSVDKLSTTYRSEPPLPSADIIALLALGRTREDAVLNESQQPTSSFVDTASNAVLGQALNAAISSRVQKIFGVSHIKIDPQVGGPENNPNARVTVEQQVNNNITLTYITNISQSAQTVIQVEYNVTRDVSIVAIRDQNGVLGFDIHVRTRKR